MDNNSGRFLTCDSLHEINAMSYRNYQTDDFINDPFFRKWALEPDPESNFFWEKWLLKHPDKSKTALEAKAIIKAVRFKEQSLTTAQKFALLQRIKITNAQAPRDEGIVRSIHEPEQFHREKNFIRRKTVKFMAYAASITLILIAVVFLAKIDTGDEGESYTWIEKENIKGQKARIFLPDGSAVLLNSSSKLIYPSAFDGETRKVYLKGEAFFEVESDTLKPFLVATDYLTAKVLGTSFNFKAYEDEDDQYVALVSGLVEVILEGESKSKVLLVPGEKAKLEKATGSLRKVAYDYDEEIAWKDGIIYFKDTPLEEALERLEQWYGVTFVLENKSNKELPVTGRFNRENLDNVLQSLSYSIKFDYQINNSQVRLIFHH